MNLLKLKYFHYLDEKVIKKCTNMYFLKYCSGLNHSFICTVGYTDNSAENKK